MFTLRYTFSLGPNRLQALEEIVPNTTPGGVSLTLRSGGSQYVIEAAPLASVDDGRLLVEKIWLGLIAYQLRTQHPVHCSMDLQQVAVPADPSAAGKHLGLNKPILGIADGNRSFIYESARPPTSVYAGTAQAFVSTPARMLMEPVEHSVSLDAAPVFGDSRLLTAIHLYRSSLEVANDAARFITLVMGVEALAAPPARHAVALGLLDRLSRDIETEKHKYMADSAELVALEDLSRAIAFQRHTSIRSSVRRLVAETLINDADVEQAKRRMVQAYDRRGTLVHTGVLPRLELIEASTDANEILRRVIAVRIQNVRGPVAVPGTAES